MIVIAICIVKLQYSMLVIAVVIVTVLGHNRGRASKRGLHWAEPEPKRFSLVACSDNTLSRGPRTGMAQQTHHARHAQVIQLDTGNGALDSCLSSARRRDSENRHRICLPF